MSASATPSPDPAPTFDAHAVENTGNPFARAVAGLRRRVVERLKGRLDAVVDALIDKAEKGDVPAAKLVLSYALGKPAAAVEPDRLNLHEGQLFKEEGRQTLDLGPYVQVPGPETALLPLRIVRPLNTQRYLRAANNGSPGRPEVTGSASCGQKHEKARPAYLDPERWPAGAGSAPEVPLGDILGARTPGAANRVDFNVVNGSANGRHPGA